MKIEFMGCTWPSFFVSGKVNRNTERKALRWGKLFMYEYINI
jgi:hypothetical protein